MRSNLRTQRWLCVGAIVGFAGCSTDFQNQTASFGGDVAGRRGEVSVVYINNTPHRAVFTSGVYDSSDHSSQPDFIQFGIDENDLTLTANATSQVLTLSCGRVFSIGSPNLFALIDENIPDAIEEPEAVVDGIALYELTADGAVEENGDGEPVVAGSALPFEALLGVDFPCNALLIISIETDDVGPSSFRIAYQVVPSESDR